MPIYPYSFQLPPLNVQDIPNDGAPGEFLGINVGGALDWLPAGGGGSGDMLAANNLSELTNFATARTNIGLGTASTPTFANLTLTSPSLSSSAPVTISQTWNAVGQTFKAFVINAAGTSDANSASGSLLLDLQVGTVSQFKVTKAGAVIVPSGSSSAPSLCFVDTDNGFYKTSLGIGYSTSTNTSVFTANYNGALGMLQDMFLGWSTAQFSQSNWDVRLYKDGAGQLALRNGTAAQTFNVYGTSSASNANYARLALTCGLDGNATISTQALGTGTAGTVSINGVPVGLGKGNVATNIAIGDGALNANTTGIFNTVIGKSAGALLTGAGSEVNVIVGTQALAAATVNTTSCCVFGVNAFQNLTSAVRSVSVGQNAGSITSLGSNTLSATESIFIGARTKALGTSSTNEIVIGESAIGIGSNSVVLGNDSITKTALKGNVGIGTTAPLAKLQVNTNNNGLNIVTVFYNENNTPTGGNAVGFAFMNESGNLTHYKASIVHERTSTWARGKLHFLLNNTEGGFQTTLADARMTIQPDGNVGIGTTSPTSKLQVVGDAFLAANGSNTAPSLRIGAGANINGWYSFGGVQLNGVVNSVNVLGIASSGINVAVGNITLGNAADVILERDAQDELALRRGALGQKFSVYGTYPNSTNWERFTITAPTSGNVLLGTYKGTGGIARGLEFQTDGLSRWSISTAGHLLPAAGNTYNIGASGGNSPSNIYASNNVVVGGNVFVSTIVASSALGPIKLIDNSGSDFGRLQFGGTTNLFPALKRSTVRIQAVLANDSGFTNIQGKLTTDTDYTATVVTPTGFLTLYDAQGNAYKVPCVAA